MQFDLKCVGVFSPADDLSSQEHFEVPEAGGWDATLSREDEDDFFDLQIVKHYDGEVNICLPLLSIFVLGDAGFLSAYTIAFDSKRLTGESRGFMGLYCPWVSPAESRRVVAWAARLPDGSSGGSAQPPCWHAAGAEKEDMCQRQPGPPGLRPQLPQKNVSPQYDTWLWRYLRGGFQHSWGKTKKRRTLMFTFTESAEITVPYRRIHTPYIFVLVFYYNHKYQWSSVDWDFFLY